MAKRPARKSPSRRKARTNGRKANQLQKLLQHADGKVLNASAIARAMRTTDGRIRRMLGILALANVIRMIPAFQARIPKRQVKAPKIFVRDASWGEQMIHRVEKALHAHTSELHFWSTYQGARLDLLVVYGKKRRGYLFTRAKKATLTKSALIARDDLELTSLDIIHYGPRTRRLAPRIRAVSEARMRKDVRR